MASYRKFVSPYSVELGDLGCESAIVEGINDCASIDATPNGILCTFKKGKMARTVLFRQGLLDSGWREEEAPVLHEVPAPMTAEEANRINAAAFPMAKRGRPPGSKNKPKGGG